MDVYESLSGGTGIPSIRWFGQECDFFVLILELLGPSLEDLFEYCERKFSLKTTLLLAEQVIFRIQYVHSKSYIHRDIKPANFLMGTGKMGNVVHIIDFGVATTLEAAHAEEDSDDAGIPFGGTARYASLRNHLGLRK